MNPPPRANDPTLALPDSGMRAELPDLAPILSAVIGWQEIERQYDEMVNYAAAMRHRTADPEAILRRFARAEVMHPTGLGARLRPKLHSRVWYGVGF